MGITGYKCKHCNFETEKKGWRIGQIVIEDHLKDVHGIETNIGDNVILIKAKPRKLWKCPICKKEMSYGNKYYHQENAEKYCLTKQ